MIKHVDGCTTGPSGFTGDIGKKLEACEYLPLVEFQTIESQPIEIDRIDLSTDQKYLLDIYIIVSQGHFFATETFASKSPGKMCHSRWLTTASRILRLYISSQVPSENLVRLVRFIMTVYVPCWFSIKKNCSIYQDPQNFFKMVENAQKCDEFTKSIVNPVLQRNSYFAHPENLLLAMLCDSKSHISKLALLRIKKIACRSENAQRKFVLPKLNFTACNYTDLINWQEETITKPPLVSRIPIDELEALSHERKLYDYFPRYPSHTQAVERAVKLVTEASASVINDEGRDGYIRNKLNSRRKMPSYDSKRDFIL